MQSAQSNWTSSVSQYLTTRRKQTHQAYTKIHIEKQSNQLNLPKIEEQRKEKTKTKGVVELFSSYESCLLEVILSALGTELEQGNTVVTLSAGLWQTQLMTIYLSHCSSLLDMPVDKLADDVIHHCNIDMDTVSTDVNNSLLSIQDNERKEYIKYQLSLAIQLQQFFVEYNKQRFNPLDSGLLSFFDALCRLPFFVNQQLLAHTPANHSGAYQSYSQNVNNTNHTNSNQHAPIVLKYQGTQLSMWIHRSWQAEQSILQHIQRLNEQKSLPLDLSKIINPNHKKSDKNTLKHEQYKAIEIANESAFSIITGGPGTGKTYTVAQLVIAIHHANEVAIDKGEIPLSLVLAAPTGKAAQRMQESLQFALVHAGVSMHLQEAKTIHRLLGIGQTGIPRYGEKMPLSEDVIIVDEASMLGVELASYLLSAVKTGARLILLGDAHQLSAVEAGAVLSDLCNLQTIDVSHANLIESRRFTDDSAVGQLATIINQPFNESETESQALSEDSHFEYVSIQEPNQEQYETVMSKVTHLINVFDDLHLFNISHRDNYRRDSHRRDKQSDKVSSNNTLNGLQLNQQEIFPDEAYKVLIKNYKAYFSYTLFLYTNVPNANKAQLDVEKLKKLLSVFNQFRILTTGHNGAYGDERINEVLTQAHRQFLPLPSSQLEWFHGRPVMVRQNNYSLGLFNGDIGLCVQTEKGLAVFFEGREQLIPITGLGNLVVTTAYAITVHKSQGSEFGHVAIMLDENTPRLLNREMMYTAVTRAKKQVSLFASNSSIFKAITSPTVRHTGLNRS